MMTGPYGVIRESKLEKALLGAISMTTWHITATRALWSLFTRVMGTQVVERRQTAPIFPEAKGQDLGKCIHIHSLEQLYFQEICTVTTTQVPRNWKLCKDPQEGND